MIRRSEEHLILSELINAAVSDIGRGSFSVLYQQAAGSRFHPVLLVKLDLHFHKLVLRVLKEFADKLANVGSLRSLFKGSRDAVTYAL